MLLRYFLYFHNEKKILICFFLSSSCLERWDVCLWVLACTFYVTLLGEEPDDSLSISTHWLDEEVPNRLAIVPLADAARDLLQEVLVVLQDLRDLVEHLVHQQRVHYGSTVRLFERSHVTLQGRKEQLDIRSRRRDCWRRRGRQASNQNQLRDND